MKRFAMAAVLIFVCVAFSWSADRTGKYALSAQFTNVSSHELALGKMLNNRNMVLANISAGFSSTSEETEFNNQTNEGPSTSAISISLIPEYRTYLRPQSSVTPYWGVFVLMGYSQSTTETPSGNTTFETTHSGISFGAGATIGAEVFLNRAISLAAHSRLLRYTMSMDTSESGTPTVTQKSTTNSFALSLSPALYVRIYF
ncbi:outer membrane beta-barrel protein [candidate division KSB1 bacterium]|nr:outer membrane beta-barrel protein [candidate division KSB1 bacterium]